ncbi:MULTISPECIES: cytochrome P450 [Streptomyces]|uniref:Cytochrome P450 n=2 Tax=Streptomyces murinus TaxID=33900 RepID=A0A7W3NLC0_STRMR|nr:MULTISPECIES: cytochrome P450 [Streptomyces]MBA9052639.1 cytochrome P450 [Streptomyces murinus]NDK27306.1 cytochrome P450 [Streptomyces sp. TR1341]UWW93846.1 cytochrome P450 [Streptomyces murinus]
MTSEHQPPTGTSATDTHDPLFGPPPGCPAGALGPGGLHRLYGAGAEDLDDLYERLRERYGPVAPVLLHDDVPMWVVLGHAENLQVVRSPSQYTRDSRIWAPLLDGRVKQDHPLMPHIAWQPICSHVEGDEHLRLRNAVTSAMATIDHRSVRRHIGGHTQHLVNSFCERGRADLVAQFAEHLPMAVLCEILGMPEEYNDRMVQAARDALKGTETAIQSHAYVMDALNRLTLRRRARPEDDFTSHLVMHEAGLSDDEVREHLRLVLFAAYEATANLLANALRMVLTEPGFRARLNGGQMTVPEAIEQSLWDEPPFSTVFGYYAKQDTELGGQRITKGDGILFAPAPGNIDPRVRPDLAASMQGNRSHLAFGGGPHECPGQDIGRAIADVGVDALLTRLPDVQLACAEDDLRWRSSIASRHLVSLPVRFEPKPQQDADMPPRAYAGPGLPADLRLPAQRRESQGAALPAAVPPPRPAPVPPVPVGAPARGPWQRLLRWWRGE